MTIGTVKWFNTQKGYGFIAPDGANNDIFVHISAVNEAHLDDLREGQRLEFQATAGKGGRLAATKLKLL